MKCLVKIDGTMQAFDLTRVHYVSELDPGDEVLADHPETHELCRGVVSFDQYNRLWVTDTFHCPAPYRWCVRKGSVYSHLYKINK